MKTINEMRLDYQKLSREKKEIEERLFVVEANMRGLQMAIKSAEK